jgi:hypothetical protein
MNWTKMYKRCVELKELAIWTGNKCIEDERRFAERNKAP